MKKKKKVKIILVILLIILLVIVGYFCYQDYTKKETIPAATVVNEIPEYGYVLKSNKSEAYKKMFQELQNILDQDPVDEEAYVKKISEMFLLDFFSLNDKVANTDVGGTDFVHSEALDNFLEKAENTIYKYVENNLYNKRKQQLPEVNEVTIDSVETTSYAVGDVTDDNAYQVTATWTYKKDLGYQTEATLIFVHEGNKLSLVELE